MKGKHKDKQAPSNKKKQSKKDNMSVEYVEDITSSDDDFQSMIMSSRKRRSRKNTPVAESSKKVKGKGRAIDTQISGATKNSKETVDQVIAVKAIIKRIWKEEYVQPLHDLVNTTNLAVTHTFALAKYIFMKEIEANNNFLLKDYVCKDFFVEIFLSLIIGGRSNLARLKDVSSDYRQVISKHKDSYCGYAHYVPPKLLYAQQIALYECTKIQTAYHNNIIAHFENRLRNMLNKLFKKKKRKWKTSVAK